LFPLPVVPSRSFFPPSRPLAIVPDGSHVPPQPIPSRAPTPASKASKKFETTENGSRTIRE